ncbi:MAG: VOC family protein [Candidatus Dojkabacteria bacterium]
MAKLVAYLGFSGNANEAMEFYKSVFGGELTINKVGDTPAAASMPPETHSSIMHSDLVSGSLRLMASDQNDSKTLVQGNNVFLCLICENEQEVNSLYEKLLEGGKTKHPLKKEYFGWFGDCTDKYGFNWMFQLDNPKAA